MEMKTLLYASINVKPQGGVQSWENWNFHRSQSQIPYPQIPNEWQIPTLVKLIEQ